MPVNVLIDTVSPYNIIHFKSSVMNPGQTKSIINLNNPIF